MIRHIVCSLVDVTTALFNMYSIAFYDDVLDLILKKNKLVHTCSIQQQSIYMIKSKTRGCNSLIERFHQVLKNMFLTKKKEQVLDNMGSFGKILASIAWAVRASYNSATDATLAQLVFGRDM